MTNRRPPTLAVPIDDAFPVGFANEMARLETYNKHHYRPNTYLHKWWARRCGSTFRLILKHLVDDLGKQDYYRPGGLEGLTILDPMMGGGTTLHEAIRLGANVIGADVDPVPILQARATLSSTPLVELERSFASMFDALRRELAHFYQTTCPHCREETEFIYSLYGRRGRCHCGPVVTVDSLILRQEKDGSVVVLCARCGDIEHRPGASPASSHTCHKPALPYTLLEKSVSHCPNCQETVVDELEGPFYGRYEPLVIAGRCRAHGLFFKKPDAADLALIALANANRPRPGGNTFAVRPGPKSIDLIKRGIDSYLDLFSSRQLHYLFSAIDILEGVEGLARLNLGLLISTSTEFNAMLCGYKGGGRRRPGAVRHTFSHHAYAFPYTALENNPLYPRKASGNLQALFQARVRRGREWAAHPRERLLKDGRVERVVTIEGEQDAGREVLNQVNLAGGVRRFLLLQGSSAALNLADDSVDHIVTDPPYFDNVQYSDLSPFFHVWLRHLLAGETGWDVDLSESAVDPQASGNGHYAMLLAAIFKECHRVLKKERGRLVFTFHHWKSRGWADLTNALREAGFVLLARYVIHSENPASVHIANLNALAHDAILVLAPGPAARRVVWEKPERIDLKDSRRFVGDCASALGWMLVADLDEPAVENLWASLLG